MQDISFWLGIALVIVGCLMLSHTHAHVGSNEIRLWGMTFKVSHPALVIIVLGFFLVILNGHRIGSVDIPDAILMPEPPVAPDVTEPAPVEPITADTLANNVAPAMPGANAEMPSEFSAGQGTLPETRVPAAEQESITASAAADAAAAAAATAALAAGLEAPAAERTDPTPATSPSPSQQVH